MEKYYGNGRYGLNPQTTTERPKRPNHEDYKSEDWNRYLEKLNEYQNENVGTYFRNNVWWWRPLWDYVYQLNDDILTEEDHELGHSNSGHEITEAQCEVICKRLTEALDNGETEEYKKGYYFALENLPLVKCDTCEGVGERNDQYVQGECNACHGKGERKDFATHYPFEIKNVEEFRNFIRESGGFAIS
jgi:predicted metal-binding protein